MTKNMQPTLDDVARLAGVSTATISRALNMPDKVAEKTRSKIDAAIATLGYTPNFGGQVLASNRTRTIGAVIPTLANSIFATALQAFQERLALERFTLLVASSGYDADHELDQIRSLMSRGADGLLLVGLERPQDTRNFLRLRNVPHVLTWCYGDTPGDYYAGFRSYDAAAALTQRIIALGHKRIGVIAAHTHGNDRARDRLAGTVDTATAAGAHIVHIATTAYDMTEGANAFDDVMQAKPTVVICANDILAAGAMARARERGINVPDDVSVTGFDDTDIASVLHPGLTTVRVPQKAMGEAAADILLALIAGSPNVASQNLGTQIVERGSLAPPRKA